MRSAWDVSLNSTLACGRATHKQHSPLVSCCREQHLFHRSHLLMTKLYPPFQWSSLKASQTYGSYFLLDADRLTEAGRRLDTWWKQSAPRTSRQLTWSLGKRIAVGSRKHPQHALASNTFHVEAGHGFVWTERLQKWSQEKLRNNQYFKSLKKRFC